MENLNKVFEKYVSEEVLTEDAKKEISVVFEAMVMEAAEKKFEIARKAMLKEYDAKFEEIVSEQNEATKNQLNDYLKHVVEEFVAENKVAIQNSIVVEKATKIIDGIQKVFESHGIKLPEGNLQVIEEMNEKNDQLMSEYNSSVNKNIELQKALEETQKAIAFMKATEGLSEVSKERLMNLMSGLVVESVNDFKSKLNIMIDTVAEAKKKAKKVKKVKEDEDEDKDDEVPDKVDEEDEDEDKDKDDEVPDKVDEEDEDEDKDDEESVKEERSKVSSYLKKLKSMRIK
jgi:hypothetical protein